MTPIIIFSAIKKSIKNDKSHKNTHKKSRARPRRARFDCHKKIHKKNKIMDSYDSLVPQCVCVVLSRGERRSRAVLKIPFRVCLRSPLIARIQFPPATSHIFVANVEPPHKQHDDGLLPSPLVSVIQLLHNWAWPTVSCRAWSCRYEMGGHAQLCNSYSMQQSICSDTIFLVVSNAKPLTLLFLLSSILSFQPYHR